MDIPTIKAIIDSMMKLHKLDYDTIYSLTTWLNAVIEDEARLFDMPVNRIKAYLNSIY